MNADKLEDIRHLLEKKIRFDAKGLAALKAVCDTPVWEQEKVFGTLKPMVLKLAPKVWEDWATVWCTHLSGPLSNKDQLHDTLLRMALKPESFGKLRRSGPLLRRNNWLARETAREPYLLMLDMYVELGCTVFAEGPAVFVRTAMSTGLTKSILTEVRALEDMQPGKPAVVQDGVTGD